MKCNLFASRQFRVDQIDSAAALFFFRIISELRGEVRSGTREMRIHDWSGPHDSFAGIPRYSNAEGARGELLSNEIQHSRVDARNSGSLSSEFSGKTSLRANLPAICLLIYTRCLYLFIFRTFSAYRDDL